MSVHHQFTTRGIKHEFLTTYTNDNVHGSIELCPLTKALIDTRHVQRLRELKQLGAADLTYINATHTRFEHSLGVMYLSEQILLSIIKKQPKLNVTPKDVLCVKIAGLLHDLGHGPYSHVYDGLFRTQLMQSKKRKTLVGDDDLSNDKIMDGWAHEDASLMMIDSMLADLGLKIDESNLDEPLRQIGDGIDARRFGLKADVSEVAFDDDSDKDGESDSGDYDDESPLPMNKVLTSRDWIFIKECIVGGPLPPIGMSIAKFKASAECRHDDFIGRPQYLNDTCLYKEFLYDVVSNRHSGLDVDKMDYLARDTLKAHGSNCVADLLPKLIEKAFVAYGEPPCDKNGQREKLLMICYPNELVQNAMSFFEKRYQEHQRLYTHQKTSRFHYMFCDILLLAEPYFRLRTSSNDNISISTCMVNSEAYLLLTDSVIDKIENTAKSELRPARDLIQKYRKHKKYEKVGVELIKKDQAWTERLWEMSEDEILDEILKLSNIEDRRVDDGRDINRDDIIVEKRQIHHGMKEKNRK